MNLYFIDFCHFVEFFLPLFATTKTNDVSIYKIILVVFWQGIVLDRLLKNFMKLY